MSKKNNEKTTGKKANTRLIIIIAAAAVLVLGILALFATGEMGMIFSKNYVVGGNLDIADINGLHVIDTGIGSFSGTTINITQNGENYTIEFLADDTSKYEPGPAVEINQGKWNNIVKELKGHEYKKQRKGWFTKPDGKGVRYITFDLSKKARNYRLTLSREEYSSFIDTIQSYYVRALIEGGYQVVQPVEENPEDSAPLVDK